MTDAERAALQRNFEKAVHGEAIAWRAKRQRAVQELDEGWLRYFNGANRLRSSRAEDIEKAAEAADRTVSEWVNLEAEDE